MLTNLEPREEMAVDLAREVVYRFLAAALRDPQAGLLALLDPASQDVACAAADLLRAEGIDSVPPLGFGELPPELLTLRPLCTSLNEAADRLPDEFVRVFGLVPTPECQPHETEYQHTTEPFYRAQQMADIAGFYQAFGLQPGQTYPERPDHLALELEFMAILLQKKRLALASLANNPQAEVQASICQEAQHHFFRDHLAWWVPSFVAGLRRKADGGCYGALGQVLGALLPLERSRFGVEAPRLPLQPALIERPEEQSGCAACVEQSS
jgi:TorA maturation chaperone TorD